MPKAPALLFGICALLFSVSASADTAERTIRIEQSEYLMTDIETLADLPDDAGWNGIELPDTWRINHPGYFGDIWYRARFDLTHIPDELWAAYLPRISMNAAVFLNGVEIGNGGSFSAPIARNWNRPLFFTLSRNLFTKGENTLHIRIKTEEMDIGRLLPFEIGPAATLFPEYESTYWQQITLLQFIFLIASLASLFSFWFWFKHREQKSYFWYAVGTGAWSLFTTYFFVRDIPFADPRLWSSFTFAAGFWMVASMMLFVRTLLDRDDRRFVRWSIGYCIATSAILLLTPAIHFFTAVALLFAPSTLLVGSTVYLLIRQTFVQRSTDLVILSSGVLINILFGIHDLVALMLKWTPPEYKLQYGVPAMLLAMSIILIRRYSQTIRQTEKLRLEVEQSEIRRQQALLQEREKIMRDLHDGIGGNLVSALSISEKHGTLHEVSDVIRHSLDDLRIIIDSLDPDESDLFNMLAMLRHRYAPRLQHHKIDFRWELDELEQLKEMDSNHALQILRIIQEGITNVIKHANASSMTLRSYYETREEGERHAVIELSDNGRGIPDKPAGMGKGLKNMLQRASEIQAILELGPYEESSGVRLKLSIPLLSDQ